MWICALEDLNTKWCLTGKMMEMCIQMDLKVSGHALSVKKNGKKFNL